jgi:myo-inositol-1(or 4)-monophosphatase
MLNSWKSRHLFTPLLSPLERSSSLQTSPPLLPKPRKTVRITSASEFENVNQCIAVDLVTEYDRRVEAYIQNELSTKYPDFSFMGEETYKPGTRLSADPTFIIDPIDGTTNFVHSNPFVAISLGFAVDRRPAVGVIYAPYLRTLWTAVAGHGAFVYKFINPKSKDLGSSEKVKLPVRTDDRELKLPTSLVAIEWGSDRSGNDFLVKSQTFAALANSSSSGGAMVHALRSYGSAALNLAHVAAGQLDMYWEAGCWAWDVCAGWCILNEAEGVMVGANPGDWKGEMDSRRYLAVRGDGGQVVEQNHGGEKMTEGQKKIIEEFWTHVKGRFEVGIDSTS